MGERKIINICPFLHFDNARTQTYEHNISIVAWNVKNILDYLEMEPDHKFCIDQVTLLEGFKRLFPNYWDSLHSNVLDGRLEIVGGTYVMPDFVLPDGESIVRQFLVGMKFFREELGVDVKTGWAIDSSGHTSQMPQILRQCGIDSYYFWRGQRHNTPSEFVWKGPDGSRVNAIWLSQGYDRAAWLSETTREAFSKLMEIIEDAESKASSSNLFVPVGGELVPPLPHLGDIVKQWNQTFPDMRTVIVTPQEYTDKLRSVQAELPVISGSLIAGRFTGVRSGGLSARVRLKIKNRRLETLLYLAELYLSLAKNNNKNEDLDNIWRILLFNQDHNLIRGTCADKPYSFAIRRYNQAIEMTEEVLADAIADVVSGIGRPEGFCSYAIFNPLPWQRDDIVHVPCNVGSMDTKFFEIRNPENKSIPYQILGDPDEKGYVEVAFIAREMPSLGYKVFTVVPSEKKPEFDSSTRVGNNWVETKDYSIEFDTFSGAISRLFDKENQFEVIRNNGNYISMESEVGDIYRHSESELAKKSSETTSLRWSGKPEIIESGPIRSIVEISGKIENSTRTQRVILYDGLKRIDLESHLDFKDISKRVRVNFPVNVFSTEVTVGTQFGAETISSEPAGLGDWDDQNGGAFPALDWVDCTGPDFGLSMITFGLHEFEFRDGILKLTLLRSVNHLSHGLDDEVVTSSSAREQGQHTFRYSLLPHSGDWRKVKSWQTASEYLYPLIGYPLDCEVGTTTGQVSFLNVSGIDLVLSCYKPTNNPNEYIVRFYEPSGISGNAVIVFDREVENAILVDLCEKEIGELSSQGHTVSIPVDSHSIITVKVRLKGEAAGIHEQYSFE
ncbi:MAG: glycoside hydrolase family 38 C-terminal domain-containing protein [Candidatus Thorarchaeota archaeon]